MRGSLDKNNGAFKHQADATLNQAAAAQNTWYTVFEVVNTPTRVIQIATQMSASNETIELRVTVDSVVILGSQAQTANTVYYWRITATTGGATNFTAATSEAGKGSFQLEGQNIKIEVRKTTVVGANSLYAAVANAKKWT